MSLDRIGKMMQLWQLDRHEGKQKRTEGLDGKETWSLVEPLELKAGVAGTVSLWMWQGNWEGSLNAG